MKHTVVKNLVASTDTTLFTVPQGYIAEVYMVFISNVSGSTGAADFWWRKGGVDYAILESKSLGSGEYIQFSNGSIIMQAGDTLMFNSGQVMTVMASFDLIQAPPMYAFVN